MAKSFSARRVKLGLLLYDVLVHPSSKLGLTASLVVRLIGLWLVFASPKIVHNTQDEMAEFVVPLRKEIKDSQTR